jgi:hypothetical protein
LTPSPGSRSAGSTRQRPPAAFLAGLLVLLAALQGLAVSGAQPALAACASNSHKSVAGTFYGQDNRDVNVSIGFDVVDRYYHGINADPATSDYGCAKNGNHGGYSIAQHEYNHYVTNVGAPQNSLQKDGTRTVRTWTLSNLPSNAAYVWVEVYSRGYKGSPCVTCFNPGDVYKYGYANRQWIPVGSVNQPLMLALTCAKGGTTGSISGRVVNSAGAGIALRNVFAWTAHRYNVGPYPQGWGSGRLGSSAGTFSLPSLAGAQPYTVWAQTTAGKVVKVTNVPVHGCKNTPIVMHG